MENEKVKELAETLKKQGLVASMYEAMEKAKRIIEDEENVEKTEQEGELKQEQQKKIEEQKQEKKGVFEKIKEKITRKEHEDAKRFEHPDYDISKEEFTVNELMKELGVNPEEVREMEKQGMIEEVREKIRDIKQDIKKESEEKKPAMEKIGEVKKEKVDELKEKVRAIKEDVEELEEGQ